MIILNQSLNRLAATAGLLLGLSFGQAHAGDVKLPEFSRHQLDNGATVLLMPKHDVPLVALDISVRGGAVQEPADRAGLATILSELMQKGAGKRDALSYAAAIDAVGGRINVGGGRHALSLSAEFLAKDSELMLDLAADTLRRPLLEQAEFEKVKTRSLQSLKAAKDSGPDRLIGNYGQAWLFGDHPYGRPVSGSEDSIARIDYADVKAFMQDHVGGNRAIITVVGDFDSKSMLGAVKKRFADWKPAQGKLAELPGAPASGTARVLLIDKPDATQTYFWLGNLGPGIDDPARPAQDLVRTVFGGRFTSMLNTELRVKSGLTYGARAGLDRLRGTGVAAITSFTRTDATEQALDMALDTLKRLHDQGIDQATLESGRNYMLGQFAPQLETAAQLADQLATLELHGLGREQIDQFGSRLRAVTEQSANAATQVFAPADRLAIVLIGKAEAIRELAKKYGPVSEMSISDGSYSPSAAASGRQQD
ncbi:M16 family metallopeptidase [Pseudomarimonas arenosa]|uniref:Insulinase family protein n=1 Tax=Pseudomarimonas arenosa TaxID=2774145 RepID=A0AAW3ZSA8_9GAMM|nr:pitrilysin family protein [Pseudomarimonas arenosa]MBD8527740.1 insulinase family protein [Pseudomarimonas arenosa]